MSPGRSYDVHGMRLNVEAQAQSLLDRVDAILGVFAGPAGGADGGHSLRLSYGSFRPADEGCGLPAVWRGLLPSGLASAYFAGNARRRIELTGLASVDIDLSARRAELVVEPGAEWCLNSGCLTPAFCEFLRPLGHHVIHAACLAAAGRAVLLAGQSGAGKTTASLYLAGRGMSLLCDDACFVTGAHGSLRVWGLPRPCKVHENTFRLLPWLADLPSTPAITPQERSIDLSSLPNAQPNVTVRPGLILFLLPRSSGPHIIEPLGKVASVARLAGENVRPVERLAAGPAGKAFEAVSQLVAESASYLLRMGERLDGLEEQVQALLDKL